MNLKSHIARFLGKMGLVDRAIATSKWTVVKYADDEAYARNEPYAVDVFHKNLLLNEGITALQNLLIGGAETNFGNTNAYLGVGDSATAASATDTGLIATTNEDYVAMEATYPQIAGQVTTWRAVFGSAVANYAWNEFTVANGNSDSADNLNRKVEVEGTKTAGQTWTLDLEITWS